MINQVSFNKYQEEASKTAIYPTDNALNYLTLGLAAEAGEVADKVAKFYRGDKELDLDEVAKELGDVLWFVSELAKLAGYPLEQIALQNLSKLKSRAGREMLQGNGDNR